MNRRELTIDLVNTDDEDIFLVLPTKPFGLDTEPGTAFTPKFVNLLGHLCCMGYRPVDFGEANDTHVTLWLKYGPGPRAEEQTKHFIDKGGDV